MVSFDLTVIVVAYKSNSLVNKCIESVLRFTDGIYYEIIIVDNAAYELDAFVLDTELVSTNLNIIKMPFNAGFSRANNEAFKFAKGKAFLLLNPDTIVFDNAIGLCYQRFMNDQHLACGVQLIFPNGSFQMSGWHFTTGNTGFFLKLPYAKAFYDMVRKSPAQIEIVVASAAPKRVQWINGAFLMVKRETVKLAGPMDDEFFLYAEEPEWCARIGAFGPLVIYPEYKVIHEVGATTGDAFQSEAKGYFYIFDHRGLQMIVSEFLRTKKQYGKGWLLLQFVIFLLYNPIFWILSGVDYILHGSNAKYQLKEVIGYLKNTFLSSIYVCKMFTPGRKFYKVR